MKCIATLFALFFTLAATYGQTNEISGTVLDKDDHVPIAGAIVQVKDSAGHTCQYTNGSPASRWRITDK